MKGKRVLVTGGAGSVDHIDRVVIWSDGGGSDRTGLGASSKRW